MKLTILEEKEAPLLLRKRVSFEVDNENQKTPSEADIKKVIADRMKVGEETVAIRHIYQKYGVCKAKVIAHVYKNADELKKVEMINKKQKKKEEKPKGKE